MYGPDSYLFETNLSLLAQLSDEELADPTIVAQITPGTTALAVLGEQLAAAIGRAVTALGAWFAPVADPDNPEAALWIYHPLY